MIDNETMEPPDPENFTDPSPNPSNDTEVARVCSDLREHGVRRVVIRYEGCGDSGGVEEMEFVPENVSLPTGVGHRFRDVAESYCPDGYENEDGGYGCLTVFPFAGLAELEHTDRHETA
jgi:hypothetical protein